MNERPFKKKKVAAVGVPSIFSFASNLETECKAVKYMLEKGLIVDRRYDTCNECFYTNSFSKMSGKWMWRCKNSKWPILIL